MRVRFPAWMLAALLLGAGVLAQDLEDDFVEYELALFEEEELVSAASRKVQKLSEAPGSIAVLRGDELETYGILTLGDALEFATSMLLTPQRQGLGVEVRGVRQPYANKILILRDGRILNSVFRGNAYLDHSLPIGGLERIEIIRGPGSALYGANAFAGFVNLVTRTGEGVHGTAFELGVGSDGERLADVRWGRKLKEGELLLSARALDAAPQDVVNGGSGDHRDLHVDGSWIRRLLRLDFGVYRNRASEPGTLELPTPGDAADRRGAYVDATRTWNFGVDKKLRVRGYYIHERNRYQSSFSDIDFEELAPGWVFSNAVFLTDESGAVIDSPTRQLLDGAARAGSGVVHLDFDAYQALISGSAPTVEASARSRERSLLAEVQFDWDLSERHYFLAGVSAKLDRLSHEDVGTHAFDDFAAFLEDEWKFFQSRLILLGSARWDQHSRFGSSFSPRISVIGVPHERVVLKGSVGTAFRSPNFVELFAGSRSGLLSVQGNPQLAQEQITTTELELNLQLTDRHRMEFVAYDYAIEDEVVFRVDRRDVWLATQWNELGAFPPLPVLARLEDYQGVPVAATFVNARETWGKGVELTFSGRTEKAVSYRASYSRSRVHRPTGEELVATGNILDPISGEVRPGPVGPLDIPELVPVLQFEEFESDQAALVLSIHPREAWWVSVRARLYSADDASILDFDPDRGQRLDLTYGYRFAKSRFEVVASVLNAFDDDWVQGSSVETERSFVFLLRRGVKRP